MTTATAPQERWTEQGNTIPVDLPRSFLKRVLADDAIGER